MATAEISPRRLLVVMIMAVLIIAMTGVPQPLQQTEQNADSNAVLEPVQFSLTANSYAGVDTSFAEYQRAMSAPR